MQDHRNAQGGERATRPDDATLNRAFDAWENLGSRVHQAIERGDLGQAAAEAATLADELASITAPPVILTEGEQELLRDETEYLIGSAADAIKGATTPGEIDDGMRKFRVAGGMLAASRPGACRATPTCWRPSPARWRCSTGHRRSRRESARRV